MPAVRASPAATARGSSADGPSSRAGTTTGRPDELSPAASHRSAASATTRETTVDLPEPAPPTSTAPRGADTTSARSTSVTRGSAGGLPWSDAPEAAATRSIRPARSVT